MLIICGDTKKNTTCSNTGSRIITYYLNGSKVKVDVDVKVVSTPVFN